jgi:hypothetical protein
VCLWITGLAGIRCTAQRTGDHASLCRPEGHGLAEIMHACGLPAWQTLGTGSGGSEGWEFGGDPAGLWSAALAGLWSGTEDRRSLRPCSSGSAGLWGGAWQAYGVGLGM